MSNNEQYKPHLRFNVVSRKRWRERPEMFLGPDRRGWWRVVMERFLGEVGAPSRRWSSAELRTDGNRVMWLDDVGTPPLPSGLFWREACETLISGSENGRTVFEMVLDSSIWSHPETDQVLHLVRRCAARASGRFVRIEVDGSTAATTSGDWREYLSDGAVVISHRSGVAGTFRFEAATMGAPADRSRAVEVLEQGVPKGTWLGLEKLWEHAGRPEVRVVLHSESAHSPEERESVATGALRRALAL